MSRRVVFATYAAQPALTEDDALAAAALERRGVQVEAAPWDAPRAWEQDAVVLRSCWDYHRRPAEFDAWLRRLTRVFNPFPLVRWNLNKSYLADLEALGVPTLPTVFLERGAPKPLGELLAAQRWEEAVVKPVLSAGAHETWRANATAPDEPRFQALLAQEALMVQPFAPEIVTGGEWSLLFFGGALSHAVLKTPAPGDFRVQHHLGGAVQAREAPPEVVDASTHALSVAPGRPLYARVDGVLTPAGYRLMELELIEPVLYLSFHPGAADAFAEALASAL